MNNRKIKTLFFTFLSFAALLSFVACPTSDEPIRSLKMQIDEDNDSLLAFDSLIIKVYSKDSSYSQEVFHGVLRDPKQVSNLPLDPRVGKEYTVSIIGYKDGKVGVNQLVTILGPGNFQSKDLIVQVVKPPDTTIVVKPPDTVIVTPPIPEILAPSDTSVVEGDSLRFRVSVRNPGTGAASLTLNDAIQGAALDTAGRDLGDGLFTWRPNFDQGQSEPYAVTFVFTSAARRVEKTTRVKVFNVNRPPKIAAIADQKVKENETLTFKVEASDIDHDSITLTSSILPEGATFSSGTFNWKPTVGQAGNFSVKFKAFDGKDSDLLAVLITVGNVDVSPPLTVKITFPGQDTAINFTPIIILYTVNGTALQKKIALKDGKNKIFVDTTVAGRTSMDTLTITLDTIPPGRPSVNGASPVHTRTPTWTWSSGGGGSGRYRYSLDNLDMTSALNLNDTTFTASKDLEPGTHTLYVQERDATGNWSLSGYRSVQIDTTHPVPPEVSVNPVSPTNNARPIWKWKGVGENLSGLFRYTVDSKDLSSGATETRSLSLQPSADKPLAEGMHSLYVQQQSMAGNWSPSAVASILIDLTPPGKPKVTFAQPSPTNNPRPTWTLSSGEGGMGFYRTKLDDSNLTQGAKSGSFAGYTPDTALANGAHTLYVQERDSAGNWSALQNAGLVVDLIRPAMPVFDSTPLSPLNSLQPTWTWKSGGGGIGTYRLKLDDSVFAQAADTIKLQVYTPTPALKEGPHALYLQERDSAGNWSVSARKSIVLATRGTIGPAGFSSSSSYGASIKLNKLGMPYVAFKVEDNNRLVVMRYINNAWEQVGSESFYTSSIPHLIFDNSGEAPYVAFTDDGREGKATVIRFNGNSWTIVGRAGFSTSYAGFTRIAISRTGVPYVGFQERGASVMRLTANGNDWEYVGSPGFSPGTAGNPSFTLSPTDVPHIAFFDIENDNKATVMRFNGTTWEFVGKAGFSDKLAHMPSLAFSSTGIPYLAFADEAQSNKMSVMRYFGNAWEYVGPQGMTSVYDGVRWNSLVIAPSGDPYLAFKDAESAGGATIVRFNGSSWVKMGAGNLTPGEADCISLDLDASGIPYIAYKDGSVGGKITVRKTAFDP